MNTRLLAAAAAAAALLQATPSRSSSKIGRSPNSTPQCTQGISQAMAHKPCFQTTPYSSNKAAIQPQTMNMPALNCMDRITVTHMQGLNHRHDAEERCEACNASRVCTMGDLVYNLYHGRF
jgi:hypothetical protein